MDSTDLHEVYCARASPEQCLLVDALVTKFMFFAPLQQVSSAKRLNALVPILIDDTSLKWSLFEIFDVPTNHDEADRPLTVFGEGDRREAEQWLDRTLLYYLIELEMGILMVVLLLIMLTMLTMEVILFILVKIGNFGATLALGMTF